MDFSKFKETTTDDQKTFSAKVDKNVYEKFLDVKRDHKQAGCAPYRIHDIVEVMLKELTEQMLKDLEAKSSKK